MSATIAAIRCRLFEAPTEGAGVRYANPLRAWQGESGVEVPFAFSRWLVVELETSNGQVGIGNAALAPDLVASIVDTRLTPLLLGRRVADIQDTWQVLYRSTMAYGRKGLGMTAISAVDIALWDALGQELGVPVHDLLGGRTGGDDPRLREPALRARRPRRAGGGGARLRGGRLPCRQAALRLGAARRRVRACAGTPSWSARCARRRRRRRADGRRLHGLGSRLRAAHAAAARAVRAALARGAATARRRRRATPSWHGGARSRSPPASTSSRSRASRSSSGLASPSCCSSTRIASAASPRR